MPDGDDLQKLRKSKALLREALETAPRDLYFYGVLYYAAKAYRIVNNGVDLTKGLPAPAYSFEGLFLTDSEGNYLCDSKSMT